MLPFNRHGVDPYNQLFAVTLHAEGTIRGVGGLRVIDEDCQTTVPGLFAAGDAAGRGAARLARQTHSSSHGPSHNRLQGFQGLGLDRQHTSQPGATDALIKRIQAEVHPLDKNLFRSGAQLERSLQALDSVWDQVTSSALGADQNPLRAREVVAMAATARWCYHAAEQRRESRGMHKRSDLPEQAAQFDAHLRLGGLDQVWSRFDPLSSAQTPQLQQGARP